MVQHISFLMMENQTIHLDISKNKPPTKVMWKRADGSCVAWTCQDGMGNCFQTGAMQGYYPNLSLSHDRAMQGKAGIEDMWSEHLTIQAKEQDDRKRRPASPSKLPRDNKGYYFCTYV